MQKVFHKKEYLKKLLLKYTKGNILRIDKFLNSVNITKRRAVSEDMCRNGVVEINGKAAKAAKDVKVGDKITINYLQKTVSYEVLQIPTTKTISKSKQSEYVKELS